MRSLGTSSLIDPPVMPAAAVLYVKDLDSMVAFYTAYFALTAQQAGDGFQALLSENWELTLLRIPEAVAATIEITRPPRRRATSPVKLVFDVAALDDACSRAASAGGRLEPDDEAWELDGGLRRDCREPEGNVLQLHQRRSTPQ